MPFLPASAAEPRHVGGGAGGVGRGQWTTTPMRVVWADEYMDTDLRVYTKHRALSRGRRATASVEKCADWLDLSESSVERANRRLGTEAQDGVVELFTKRRTHEVTGTGRTAERWTRPLEAGERYVSAPVLAADTLRGPLYRLYLLARYTQTVEKRDLTLAEIARVLRHRSGKRAGQPLAEATASHLLDELAATGWIGLDKRGGYRGRHRITVHDHPVHLAPEPEASPEPGDGSGPDLGDGSLAYKEDQPSLNDLGSTDRRGSFRRRRDDRKWAREPGDTASNPAGSGHPAVPTAPGVPAALRGRVRPAAPPAYAGPPLTLSRDAWELVGPVLAPVSDLLPRVSVFVMRRIVREILRQVRDTGFWPEDIRDQVARMRAWTAEEDLTDPGRWLLGAVLPPASKCGRPGCHWGYLAHTGEPCKACAEVDQAVRRRGRDAHPPHTAPRPPRRAAWHECADCGRPSRQPIPGGRCRTCA